MAKPILIVYVPYLTQRTQDEERQNRNFEEHICEVLGCEYHVFITKNAHEDKYTFKLFSDKEIDPISIEQLKEIINQK